MGNHDELLKNYPNGTYSKLVADQEKIDQQHLKVSAQRVKEGEHLSAADSQAAIDEEAAQKMEEANVILQAETDKLNALLEPITNEKK